MGAAAAEGLYTWDDDAATLESVQAALDRIDLGWRDVVRVMGRVH